MRIPLLFLLLPAALGFADSWAPHGDKTYTSPDGKHTLVVHNDRSFQLGGVRGTLTQLPLKAHVLNGGKGAVLFDRYGGIGHGDIFALLDAAGEITWAVRLHDVFGKRLPGEFMQTAGSVWWNRAWWVDEARNKIVSVARDKSVHEFDLATGAIEKADGTAIATGIALPHARNEALELAIEYGIKEAQVAAAPLAADDTLPVATRLRAAVLVQLGGGPGVKKELFQAALGDKEELKDRRWALGRLAAALGEDARELAGKAVQKPETAYEALRVLAQLKGAARTLASLIATGDTPPAVRDYAGALLGRQPAAEVRAAILAEIKDAEPAVAGPLVRAGIVAKVEGLGELLVPHEKALLGALDKETAPVVWLAEHFKAHPTTEAVQPLLRALVRHAREGVVKVSLIESLKACTGLDYGTSVAAWLKALRR